MFVTKEAKGQRFLQTDNIKEDGKKWLDVKYLWIF